MQATPRAMLGALLLAVTLQASSAGGQTSDQTLERGHEVVQQLTLAAKYKEAEALALKLEEAYRQRDGEGSERHARALHMLAEIYRQSGELRKAAPIQRRACSVAQRVFGEAHAVYGICINNLSVILEAMGQSDAAEQLQRRALQTRERANGHNHPDTAQSLNNLATILQRQGKLREAEELHRRALGIRERLPRNPDLAQSLANLAATLSSLGRHAEAEDLYQRALIIAEQTLGRSHPHTASVLNNLAVFYRERGRPADAEPLLKRVVEIFRAISGTHPDAAIASVNLAMCLVDQGKLVEAEPILREALGLLQRQGLNPGSTIVVTTFGNYADVLRRLGRIDEAVKFAELAQTALARSPASDPSLKAQLLIDLALSRLAQGHARDALGLHAEALEIRRRLLPPDHPLIVTTLGNMGVLSGQLGDWTAAERYLRMATTIASSRIHAPVDGSTPELREEEITRGKDWFAQHARALHRAAPNRPSAIDEAFLLAQRAEQSKAAVAVAQLTARLGSGSGALAGTVRQLQDLRHRRAALEQHLLQALSLTQDTEGRQRSDPLRRERDEIDGTLKRLQSELIAAHPDYAALVEPSPVTIREIQRELRLDEVAVLFLLPTSTPGLPDEGLIFVVGKAQATWRRLAVGTRYLQEEVFVLRCGLDHTAWNRPEDARACRDKLRAEPERATEGHLALPFDAARAHRLYRDLLGSVEDLIAGKRLLIVPSGPLTQLPLHVLVTQPPAGGDLIAVRWLARENAITVLPAIASLRGIRRVSAASKKRDPLIGFGNPLLVGPSGRDQRASTRSSCTPSALPKTRQDAQRRAPPAAISAYFRGGSTDVEAVRRNTPLPETADELCAVARTVGASPDAVHLGARATERMVKSLSASGALARVRVLHFATHGLLAAETKALLKSGGEPALVLTPPTVASVEDDGLLTASEIAGLTLDADWVVLSACNTAASGGGDAEPLSGLARSFFYAGTRALLVSHWYVDSDAAVVLIKETFAALEGDRNLSRAVALQRAMSSLIDQGGAGAHPAYWAPFVVVGEASR